MAPVFVNKVTKHPFLLYEDQTIVNLIKRGRSDKICALCGQSIPIGMHHKVHMFTDYESYPTHLECSLLFSASLL